MLAEIARDALLDELGRGDARHALRLLLSTLDRRAGLACGLHALAGDGALLWSEGPVRADVPSVALPIERLGARVGVLHVAGVHDAAALAETMEPLWPTLAALLQRAVDVPAADASAAHAELIRAALSGADTFVWEWQVDSDVLPDIAVGVAMLGYDPAEVGGLQADWDRLIHPDDREANHQAYLRHARGEVEVYEHAYRIRHRNGRWRWMLERGRVVERRADGTPRRMVGTQTDITERRAVERAASLAALRLERISRQVPGLLFQYELGADGQSHLRYVSERGRELFGLDLAKALDDAEAALSTIEIDDRRRMHRALLASATSLGEWRCDFRVRHPNGQRRWMLGTATPERQDDGAIVWHGYVEDITERRELDQARHDAAVADAANRAKTDFLSRMSHELRTPLNAVLGFAQLMEIDPVEPPGAGQLRRLKIIREAGEHLLHMIGDLLDLTRIEAGGMALQPEPVPLYALAAQALELVRTLAEKAQVALVLHPGAEVVAWADRTRARQVLLNLLSNAIKYNRPGGRVELRVGVGDDGHAVVSVSDTGVGIAESELALVFEPFHRGQQDRSGIEGAGIGLAVTRALVQLMGGEIRARSTPGAGSVFSVTLPQAAGQKV